MHNFSVFKGCMLLQFTDTGCIALHYKVIQSALFHTGDRTFNVDSVKVIR